MLLILDHVLRSKKRRSPSITIRTDNVLPYGQPESAEGAENAEKFYVVTKFGIIERKDYLGVSEESESESEETSDDCRESSNQSNGNFVRILQGCFQFFFNRIFPYSKKKQIGIMCFIAVCISYYRIQHLVSIIICPFKFIFHLSHSGGFFHFRIL